MSFRRRQIRQRLRSPVPVPDTSPTAACGRAPCRSYAVDDPGRVAADARARAHIPGDEGARLDERPCTDPHPLEDRRVGADPDVVLDDDGPLLDRRPRTIDP